MQPRSLRNKCVCVCVLCVHWNADRNLKVIVLSKKERGEIHSLKQQQMAVWQTGSSMKQGHQLAATTRAAFTHSCTSTVPFNLPTFLRGPLSRGSPLSHLMNRVRDSPSGKLSHYYCPHL